LRSLRATLFLQMDWHMHQLHTAIGVVFLTGCAVISDADEALRKDGDGDGVHWRVDCDDEEPEVGLKSIWYQDLDEDGYGSDVSLEHCISPEFGVLISGDCNDKKNDGGAAIHPDATEECNGIDDNCDGEVDEGCEDTGDLL